MGNVKPFSPQPDGPASGETDASISTLSQQRMLAIRRRQLCNVGFNGIDHRRASDADLRFNLAEERAVSLRSAAQRLVEILAAGLVDRPEQVREAL